MGGRFGKSGVIGRVGAIIGVCAVALQFAACAGPMEAARVGATGVEPALPVKVLRPAGTLRLGVAPAPEEVVRDIRSLDVDDRGRLGFIRGREGAEEESCTLVLVDADGKTIVSDLGPAWRVAEGSGRTGVAWVGQDRWVTVTCEYGIEKDARAWFVDVGGEGGARVTAVEGFECSAPVAIVGTGDGGFVVLGTRTFQYTMTDELVGFDERGKRRWTVHGQSGDPQAALFSPEALAVDRRRGEIFVVENVGKRVQVFDLTGKLTRSIDLRKAFGREPNYPAGIAVQDGRLVIHDFSADPPLWRLTADGLLLDTLTPHFGDGRHFYLNDIRVSPEGRLWISDGSILMRLAADGQVDRVLGRDVEAAATDDIAAIAVGPGGRIYTAGRRGGAVQVFDATGRRLQVMRAEPGDFSASAGTRWLTVAGDGSGYLAGRISRQSGYLHFRADGKRVGWETLGLDEGSEEWQFVPGTGKRWVQGYRGLWLVGEDGKVLRDIRLQPDGKELVGLQGLTVAEDGSAAVVAWDMMGVGEEAVPRLNVYGADGTPRRTNALPGEGFIASVAFDGKRAVIGAGERLMLADIGTGTVRVLQIPVEARKAGAHWQVLRSPDGKELWVRDLNRRRMVLDRYEWPAE
jgi:sugar lactone lactonase YvrE